MATVHNPTRVPLLCEPIHRVLRPGETAEVTDGQAEATSTAIFVVTRDSRRAVVSTDTQVDSQELAAPVATRRRAARGSGVAEVNEGPAAETR